MAAFLTRWCKAKVKNSGQVKTMDSAFSRASKNA